MVKKMDIYNEMAQSVVELEMEKAKSLAQKSIEDKNLPLLDVIEKGFGAVEWELMMLRILLELIL